MNKILRVNMSDLTTRIETVPPEWIGLGGRALTSTIVAQEVEPTCHPLSANNKLVFAPGMLSGTIAANTGRLSAGAKSPLTGTIKESNAGGTAAQLFAHLAIKALIIEGEPQKDTWYSLFINKDGISIAEETELIGQGNFSVVQTLEARHGKNTGVITIGPPGEMKMLTANISVKDKDSRLRSHGRGGLGAVMGAKRIKFIAIDKTDAPGIELANPEKFKTAAKSLAKAILSHPGTGEGLPTFGTAEMVNIINSAGSLPTRNFTYGQYEGHENISGETMREVILARGGSPKHGCQSGCIIQCSQVYTDEEGQYVTSGFEYETIETLGANACVGNLDDIAQADYIMDDIGVDSIETAVTFGVAMEAGILPFGDGKEVLRILKEEIAVGTPLGRILGSGAGNVGKIFGVTRVPVVKNQGIPAYDPRAIKGIGITYATSTMGADHTAGYSIGHNLMGCGGRIIDPLKKDEQVDLSRRLQTGQISIDSVGLCHFVGFPMEDDPTFVPALMDLINSRFGMDLTPEWIEQIGQKTLKIEREFNLAAGFTEKDDRLPDFFKEPLTPHNAKWDFTGDEIDAFWEF